MKCIGIRNIRQRTLSVVFRQLRGNIPYRCDTLRAGTEVPSLTVSGGLLKHLGGKEHIAGERLQDMLPGTDGLRASDLDESVGLQGADGVDGDVDHRHDIHVGREFLLE